MSVEHGNLGRVWRITVRGAWPTSLFEDGEPFVVRQCIVVTPLTLKGPLVASGDWQVGCPLTRALWHLALPPPY